MRVLDEGELLSIEPDHHRLLGTLEIRKRDGRKSLSECTVRAPPQRSDRAVGRANALAALARMAVAEPLREKRASQGLERIPDGDLVRRAPEAVAARSAAGRRHEPGTAQGAHEARRVLGRNAFSFRYGSDAYGRLLGALRNPQQAAQAVLLLSRGMHAQRARQTILTSQY